ncbi:hypothetical protein BpHYR1_040518 [Brachionus plicatilis]|uniref:Uncharacterized protein n=1 Tax=Brachionus plicatilis TaxID=10195 RepID=A0A3M7T160_BRAPC|nr:hypothetical protein BpHYR1_040518 [Brachionus plicatilis]
MFKNGLSITLSFSLSQIKTSKKKLEMSWTVIEKQTQSSTIININLDNKKVSQKLGSSTLERKKKKNADKKPMKIFDLEERALLSESASINVHAHKLRLCLIKR